MYLTSKYIHTVLYFVFALQMATHLHIHKSTNTYKMQLCTLFTYFVMRCRNDQDDLLGQRKKLFLYTECSGPGDQGGPGGAGPPLESRIYRVNFLKNGKKNFPISRGPLKVKIVPRPLYFRVHLGLSGSNLDKLGQIWTSLDKFEQFWTNSDKF